MGSPPLKPAGLPMEADQFTSNRDGRRRKREDLLGIGSELPCTNKKRRAPGEHRTFKVNLAPDDTRRFTIPLYRSWDQFETLLRDEYPWAFDLPEGGDDVVMIRYEDESRDLCILSSQSEWEALCHNRLLGPIVRLRITHEKPRFPSVKPEPTHEDYKDSDCFQPPSLPFPDNDINNSVSQEGRGSPAVKAEPMLHHLGDEVFAGLGPSEDALPFGPADVSAVATTATTTATATTTTTSLTPSLMMDRTMVQIKIEKADDDNINNAMTMMYSDRDAEPQGTRQKEEDEEKKKKKVKEEETEEEEKEEEGMMGIISRWTPGWMRLFRKSSPLLVDPETFPPVAPEEAQPEPEPEPELEGSQEQALDRDESVRRKRRRSSSDDRRRSSTDGTRRRLRRSASAAAK